MKLTLLLYLVQYMCCALFITGGVPETKGASIVLLHVLEKLEIWGGK